jgi:hypothetical protein
MRMTRTCLAVLFALSSAATASAQAVKIEFKDGLVTMSAQNAPLRTILTEWTRQGGTRILNGERITGTPLTFEFTNTPERQALETILRSVSGYMLAPRRQGSTVRSTFESILIIPTSTAAPRPTGGPAPGNTPNQPTAFRPPQIPQIPPVAFDPNDPEENPPGDIAPDEPQEDLPTRLRRVQRLPQNPNIPGTRQPEPDGPDDPDAEDVPPAARPTNPFGVQPGSNRPGFVTPVPPRAGQNRNGQPQEEP